MKIEGGDDKNMWGQIETNDGGGLPFRVTTAGEAQVTLPISKQIQVGNQTWEVVATARGVALSTKGGEGFSALTPLRFLEEHIAKEGVLSLFGIQVPTAAVPASVNQAEGRRRARREAAAKTEPEQAPPAPVPVPAAAPPAPPVEAAPAPQEEQEEPEREPEVLPPAKAEVAKELPKLPPPAAPRAPVKAPAPPPPAPPAPVEKAYGPGYNTGLPAEVFEMTDGTEILKVLMPIAYDAIRQEFEEAGKLEDWYDVVGSSWAKRVAAWVWERVSAMPLFQGNINPNAKATVKWSDKHVGVILGGLLNKHHAAETEKYLAAQKG